jgi:hypothetical protein
MANDQNTGGLDLQPYDGQQSPARKPVRPNAQANTTGLDLQPYEPVETAGQPQKDSLWRKVYDTSILGQLHQVAGGLSDWAQKKANQKEAESIANAGRTGQASSFASEALSPRGGYDLLAHTAGLARSFLEPQNVAITGGVVAANTNPFTGIPVDAALVAHGGYGVAKNAKQALAGNPQAVESALLSGSEMVGGAAGTAAQVGALPRIFQNLRGGTPASAAAGKAPIPGTPEQAAATGEVPAEQGPGAPAQVAVQAPSAGGRIAQTLGITDPEPKVLLTKAIKPMSSNTGWDSAIAKAAPDMKAVESDLGHPITGVDDALSAVNIAKKGIWQKYADKINAAQQAFPNAPSMSTIDGSEIADAMMGSIDKRTALQDPGLVERITKVANTYRRPMGMDEAEDFLQSANNDLHSYYAKNKVGRQVAERDPATGHVVAEADQLRNSLYSTLDNLTGPGAADLKARYGALSNVEAELLRRKNVSARQQPESLAEQISMARAYGKIAVGAARLSPTSMLEGTQSLYAAKWLKARGTTDAMITRAFRNLGTQRAAPSVPKSAAPSAVSGIGAAAASGGSGFRTNADIFDDPEMLARWQKEHGKL